VVLETLKGLKLGLDEETMRRLMSETEGIEYGSFIDSLDYDPRLRRWVNPACASTSLSTLSRNLQLSPSNTCMQPTPPSPKSIPTSSAPSAAITTL